MQNWSYGGWAGWSRGNIAFGADVQAEIFVPMQLEQKFKAEVSEAFLGNVEPQKLGQIYISVK